MVEDDSPGRSTVAALDLAMGLGQRECLEREPVVLDQRMLL